jgi:hypothetical protein
MNMAGVSRINTKAILGNKLYTQGAGDLFGSWSRVSRPRGSILKARSGSVITSELIAPPRLKPASSGIALPNFPIYGPRSVPALFPIVSVPSRSRSFSSGVFGSQRIPSQRSTPFTGTSLIPAVDSQPRISSVPVSIYSSVTAQRSRSTQIARSTQVAPQTVYAPYIPLEFIKLKFEITKNGVSFT